MPVASGIDDPHPLRADLLCGQSGRFPGAGQRAGQHRHDGVGTGTDRFGDAASNSPGVGRDVLTEAAAREPSRAQPVRAAHRRASAGHRPGRAGNLPDTPALGETSRKYAVETVTTATATVTWERQRHRKEPRARTPANKHGPVTVADSAEHCRNLDRQAEQQRRQTGDQTAVSAQHGASVTGRIKLRTICAARPATSTLVRRPAGRVAGSLCQLWTPPGRSASTSAWVRPCQAPDEFPEAACRSSAASLSRPRAPLRRPRPVTDQRPRARPASAPRATRPPGGPGAGRLRSTASRADLASAVPR